MWLTTTGLTGDRPYAFRFRWLRLFSRADSGVTREHFDEVAGKVDSILNRVAWTTSSELVGHLGAVIRDFERTQPVVSPSLRSALEQCARIVVRVWPDFPN